MVRRHVRIAALAALALTAATPAAAQIVGENVNMVSGTQWPGGDPFLQRQNEPTLAVSSVNPQHLMAGANDYRSVDIPFPTVRMAAGDAWLGLFKSLDGGQTWRSVLLPGYPQSCPPSGQSTSPLCAKMTVPATFAWDVTKRGQSVDLPASADPVMRAGTDGLFYYSGINFARDKSVSRVFVARFVDLNDRENGDATRGTDPIRYLGTTVVATSNDAAINGGQHVFIDKPWMAVDVPRAGARTCTVPDGRGGTRTILAGNVYLAWAQFDEAESVGNVMFTWSSDCGETWTTPSKLNTVNSTLNNGVSIAIEPITGRVYVAWRRMAAGKQGAAIMATRSSGRKRHFAAPRVVANIIPFDLGYGKGQARTESFPSLAISSDGANSWAHVVWAGRTVAQGPSRIWISNAQIHPPPAGDQDDDDADEIETETRVAWTKPALAQTGQASDDLGHVLTRGHQYMPSITSGQGRVVLFHYDSRLDHTRRLYTWAPGKYPGRFYEEELAPFGDWAESTSPASAPGVFDNNTKTPPADLDDSALAFTRHTIDVRAGMALAGPSPAFSTQLVSRFPFGTTGSEDVFDLVAGFSAAGTDPAHAKGLIPMAVKGADGKSTVQRLQQLQFNPPGFPLFKGGNAAFIGDYIDVQGPNFVVGPSGWAFDVARSKAPVFHATWTSNQDVKVPPFKNGEPDWAGYTPPGRGGASLYDASSSVNACVPGYAGSRDQNIYTARLTEGLQVSTPQTAKFLASSGPTSLVVAATNTTGQKMRVRFGAPVFAAASPAGSYRTGYRADFTMPTVDEEVGPYSSVHRTLFVARGTAQELAPTIRLTVDELDCGAACRSASLTFNPPIALASLQAAVGAATAPGDGEIYRAAIGAPNITNPNITNPNITNPNITNPNITNPNITNPNITNPNITNPNITNPNITNPNITNPNITNPNITNPNITNPNITNPNITNPNITNPNITNPNITNPNITNAAVSDLSYTVTNTGNTTTTYRIQVVDDDPTALPPTPLQLVVSRTYYTPAAAGCDLKEVPHDQILANVPDVSTALVKRSDVVDPNITNPNVTNATVALAPGESAVITLRAPATLAAMAAFGAHVGPAAVPQAWVPRSDVTYGNVASLVPGSGVVTPGARSATTLTYDRATGHAAVTVRPASGSGATPTGAVFLIAGGTTRVAALALDGAGNASADLTPPLPTGATLLAYYAGDAGYAASTSAAVTVASTGTATPTFMALTYDVTSSTISVGRLVVLPNPWPTGELTFYVNGNPVVTTTMPASGPTTVTTPVRLARGDQLTFSYSGDDFYAPRGQGTPVTVVIPLVPTQTTVSYDASRPFLTVTLTAPGAVGGLPSGAALPSGGVRLTWQVAGGGTWSPGNLYFASGGPGTWTTGANTSAWTGAVAILPGGQITAEFLGDVDLAPSSGTAVAAAAPTQTAFTYDVFQRTASVQVSCLNPGPFGQRVTGSVAVAVNGAVVIPAAALTLPANQNVCRSTAVVSLAGVPPLGTGDTLSVTYLGDSNYASSSAATSVTLASVVATITDYDIMGGLAFVHVAPVAGGGPAPTGEITFTRNGAPLLNATAVTGGTTSCAVPGLSRADVLVATYQGDPVYERSSSAPLTVAGLPSQTMVSYDPLTWIASATVSVAPPYAPTWIPTGDASFWLDAAFAGTTPLAAGAALVALNSPPITVGRQLHASYPGDFLFEPSSSATIQVTGFSSAPPMPSARKAHGTVAIGTTIYVFGGNGSAGAGTSIDAYDTVTGTWSARPAAPANLSGGFNTAAAAVGDVIHVFTSGQPVLHFDTVAQAWSQGTSLGPTFAEARAVELGGQVYLFALRSAAHRYDPVADTFTALATDPVTNYGGAQFSTAVFNGKIYLFSGVGPHGIPALGPPLVLAISEFDPGAGPLGAYTVMPVAFTEPVNWGAAATINGKIYVLGGGAYVPNDGTVHVYDPVAQTLVDYPVARPAPTYGFDGAVVDGVFYLTGGGDDATVAQTKVDAFVPAP